MLQWRVGLAGGLLLSAGVLAAQTGTSARVAVSDPAELASLGFPRDAKNVFRWVAPRVEGVLEKAAGLVAAPKTWGVATGFTALSPMDLIEEHTSAVRIQPERAWCALGNGGQGAAQEALAQVQVPEGVALDYLELWGYDDEPTYGMQATLYEFCQSVGYNPPTTTLIGSIGTLGANGYTYDATPLFGYPVNNRDCGYSVRVIFIPGDATCRSDHIQFRKATVLWHRLVSPPPATATFSDVPTDHPFFPFIEALAASGITGGCGGGKFCPDNPLTRGQMAVFLAKGLGMGWQ
ncbi:MAG TPA: S-layer homology domain-containing protein [Thermoanaerobaculia bacterium]|nr:S-layer homology domain-containing protein [Thermoanaerobaculia bacterium]